MLFLGSTEACRSFHLKTNITMLIGSGVGGAMRWRAIKSYCGWQWGSHFQNQCPLWRKVYICARHSFSLFEGDVPWICISCSFPNPMGLLLLYVASVHEKHFCKCNTLHYNSINEKRSESGPIRVAHPCFQILFICLPSLDFGSFATKISHGEIKYNILKLQFHFIKILWKCFFFFAFISEVLKINWRSPSNDTFDFVWQHRFPFGCFSALLQPKEFYKMRHILVQFSRSRFVWTNLADLFKISSVEDNSLVPNPILIIIFVAIFLSWRVATTLRNDQSQFRGSLVWLRFGVMSEKAEECAHPPSLWKSTLKDDH